MKDDNFTEAQAALRDANDNLHLLPEDAGAPIAAALTRVAAALERIQAMGERATEAEHLLAAQQALLDDRLLRVENNVLFTVWRQVTGALAHSPLRAWMTPNPARQRRRDNAEYSTWVAHEQASLPSIEQGRAWSAGWTYQPRVSVVLVARNREWLAGSLASLQNQAYPNWELCVTLDEGSATWALPLLQHCDSSGLRFRSATMRNPDTASALNAAAALASGEYISFIEDGDLLSPFALYYLAESLQTSAFDVLYSDEDEMDAERHRIHPIFKPDWSPDLLTSCMYMGRFVTVSRRCLMQSGGLRSEYAASPVHDLLLRLADSPLSVRHVPRVLCHARGGAQIAKTLPAIDRATAQAIEQTVARREGADAACEPGPAAHTFTVRRKLQTLADVTVIICSKSPALLSSCLESLRLTAKETVRQVIVVAHEESGVNRPLRGVIERNGATAIPFSGIFNFALMNNLGARAAQTPYLLFLNDDVRATSKGWAEMLREQLTNDRVGIAGAILWYPAGGLQHAGIVTGIGDGVGHAGRYMRSCDIWPWLLATRNVSATTGACLAVRNNVFRELGEFDISFPNNYNDVDLCLQARGLGYEVVCVPVPGLIHAECQTRKGVVRFDERYRFYRKWSEVLSRPDPYYSPSLSRTEAITLNLKADPGYAPLLTGG